MLRKMWRKIILQVSYYNLLPKQTNVNCCTFYVNATWLDRCNTLCVTGVPEYSRWLSVDSAHGKSPLRCPLPVTLRHTRNLTLRSPVSLMIHLWPRPSVWRCTRLGLRLLMVVHLVNYFMRIIVHFMFYESFRLFSLCNCGYYLIHLATHIIGDSTSTL